MGHKLPSVPHSATRSQYDGMRDFAGCDSNGFKLKKSIAAIILFDCLEEDGKRENRRGKIRGWIRRRERKDTSITSYRD